METERAPLTVAVLGPGALGKAYAFALAGAGARVVLVYRRARAEARETLRAVRLPLGRSPRAREVELSVDIPECDVVLVTLRNESLDAAQLRRLAELQARPTPPLLVVLTPLLPLGIERVRQALPHALLGVPAVAAEVDATAQPYLRYWSAPFVASPVEPPAVAHPAFTRLVQYSRRGGLPIRPCDDVAQRSPATTIAFFPLQLALTKNDRMSDWPRHPSLIADVAAAIRQCRRVARQVGPIEAAVTPLVSIASTRRGLWWLCQLSRAMPRLSAFLGRHFGHKLLDQHQRFLVEIQQLSRAARLPIDRLLALTETPADQRANQ